MQSPDYSLQVYKFIVRNQGSSLLSRNLRSSLDNTDLMQEGNDLISEAILESSNENSNISNGEVQNLIRYSFFEPPVIRVLSRFLRKYVEECNIITPTLREFFQTHGIFLNNVHEFLPQCQDLLALTVLGSCHDQKFFTGIFLTYKFINMVNPTQTQLLNYGAPELNKFLLTKIIETEQGIDYINKVNNVFQHNQNLSELNTNMNDFMNALQSKRVALIVCRIAIQVLIQAVS